MNVKDQLNRNMIIRSQPERIISLVPSQTELLFDLGLDERIVGRTKFCIHPKELVSSKPIIGGTKNPDHQKISDLKPDLIIANKEENNADDIAALEKLCPVWVSDVNNRYSAMQMISALGDLLDCQNKAYELIQETESAFGSLIKRAKPKVLYLIWRKPWMAAGRDTFISSMMTEIGLINCIQADRYPELTDEEIVHLNPYIFLSSEPFPFHEKHVEELQYLLPQATIRLVDGEMFSWYGSRMKYAPAYFNQLTL